MQFFLLILFINVSWGSGNFIVARFICALNEGRVAQNQLYKLSGSEQYLNFPSLTKNEGVGGRLGAFWLDPFYKTNYFSKESHDTLLHVSASNQHIIKIAEHIEVRSSKYWTL